MYFRSLLGCLVVTAGLLCAQSTSSLPLSLVTYFALTPAQVTSITQLNNTFDDLVERRISRVNTLLREVNAELGKSSPDPGQVGSRYVERELIFRELDTAYAQVISDVQKSLTAEQNTKLNVLIDAAKAAPTVDDAEYWYFFADPFAGGTESASAASSPGAGGSLKVDRSRSWQRMLRQRHPKRSTFDR